MLIVSMHISRIMAHAEQIEEKNLKQVCWELKKVRTEKGNSFRLDLRFKTNQTSRIAFPIKALIMLQGSTTVTCLLQIPKRGKLEYLMLKSLFVQNVIRDMTVST